jgi:hypothetical protein
MVFTIEGDSAADNAAGSKVLGHPVIASEAWQSREATGFGLEIAAALRASQ